MGNYSSFSNSLELDDSPYALEDEFRFQFDEWVKMNGLNSIKNVFIKHSMVTLSSLTVASNEFRDLIHDRLLLSNPEYIPQIVDALHALRLQQMGPKALSKKKSVIIDEDDEIFSEIHNNLILLQSVKTNINEMNEKHPNNEWYVQQARTDQIEETKKKINISFNNINQILKAKQNGIINQLDALKSISKSVVNTDDVKTNEVELSKQEEIVLDFDRNQLLVFGYIRENSLVLIPLDVMKLCALWYQCWDTYHMHNDMVLCGDMICRKYPCSRGWATTFVADSIKNGTKMVRKFKLIENMQSNMVRNKNKVRCWIIIGLLETSKILQYEDIDDFTNGKYKGIGLCTYDGRIYQGGSSGVAYLEHRKESWIQYEDVICVEIDRTSVEHQMVIRYGVNNQGFGDGMLVKMKGDCSLAVAINAGETDYVQLLM